MSSPTSGITANSTDLDQHQLSTLNLSASGCLSSDWTDEKHSMYLESMEASFVDQLYTSMNSSARRVHDMGRSRVKSTKHTQVCMRNQLKVHQIGSRNKGKFDKGESSPQETEELHRRQGTQWTQHCGVGIRNHHLTWGNIAEDGSILNSGARMLYSSIGQEFSDQNFDENNDNEANGGGMHASKRAKIIAKSSSSKYQVNVQNL